MGYYHIAQICLNGHMINDAYDEYPQHNQNFCDRCGAKTITTCPKCNTPIRGDYDTPGICNFDVPPVPSYCYNCGNPYPWTEQKLESAQELLSMETSLTQDELEYFASNMNSILVDTPKTKVVATKLKMTLSKVAPVVGNSLRELLIDICSEAAKKIIWPNI